MRRIVKNLLVGSFPRIFFRLREIFYILFVPPPTSIAIEINSFCNRKCRFCPNFNNTRESTFLEEELFYKIIQDLKNMKFKGAVTFNLFNEPLLDKRLLKFIEHVRGELPSVYLEFNTNGDLLDLNFWNKLRSAGLDFANITQYDGKINDNIQKILNSLAEDEKKHFFAHTLSGICNRGGLIETESDNKPPFKKFCRRPFYQLCIDSKAKVVLCCNDYFSSIVVGDLRNESIPSIWKSRKLKYYRWRLFLKDRAHLKLCDVCDM